MRVSIPDPSWLQLDLSGLTGSSGPVDVDLTVWDPRDPQPQDRFDLVVWPYTLDPSLLGRLDTALAPVVQGQSLGYDGVADVLPRGGIYCNAVGVHEESTAELAVTLALASARRFDVFGPQQVNANWEKHWTGSLIDRTVLLLGVGGIGGQVATRLGGFGCEVLRVGTTARDDASGHVHGIDELAALLPRIDVVIVAVPLNDATRGLVDADFLAALPDGAIVVNVARGPVVDTTALLAEVGRIRFASDVFDPEPLPADHPLWRAPGVIVTPHVGGMSSAMRPRIERVVRRQIAALARGDEPVNVAVRT